MYKKVGLAMLCLAILTFGLESMLAQIAVSAAGSSGEWLGRMTLPAFICPGLVLVIGWVLMRIEEQ